MSQDYEKRIRRVLQHIYDHPDGDLSLDALADVATLPHRGAYTAIGSAFEQLGSMMTARNLWPQIKGMIGVYYDDPDAVAEADLRSSAGVIVGDDFAMPEDLQEIRLQGDATQC